MEPKRTQKNETGFLVSILSFTYVYIYIERERDTDIIYLYNYIYRYRICTFTLQYKFGFICLGDVSWTYQIELDDLRYLSP